MAKYHEIALRAGARQEAAEVVRHDVTPTATSEKRQIGQKHAGDASREGVSRARVITTFPLAVRFSSDAIAAAAPVQWVDHWFGRACPSVAAAQL